MIFDHQVSQSKCMITPPFLWHYFRFIISFNNLIPVRHHCNFQQTSLKQINPVSSQLRSVVLETNQELGGTGPGTLSMCRSPFSKESWAIPDPSFPALSSQPPRAKSQSFPCWSSHFHQDSPHFLPAKNQLIFLSSHELLASHCYSYFSILNSRDAI